MKKLIPIIIVLILVVSLLVGCNVKGGFDGDAGMPYPPALKPDISWGENEQNSGAFEELKELPFFKVSDNPNANVSLSANTAAYAILRNAIKSGYAISPNQVRTEEMINYFKYGSYTVPAEKDFGLNYGLMKAPWNTNNYLLTLGMKTKELDMDNVPPSNFVFLIDISGSMSGADRLGLVQKAFVMLTDNLRKDDKVSVITYASGEKLIFEGKGIDDRAEIITKINKLSASGATAGAKAIQIAYEVAERQYIQGGNNRIIMATDGDFNVGVSSTDQLKTLVKEKVTRIEKPIYFSMLGVGAGNMRDDLMTAVANAGQGNYNYLDSESEAKKVLINEMGGTLFTLLRDAKARIEFSSLVDSYRIIGYENRRLTDEEFEDNDTDAGEIGAGHEVTIVFEIVLSEGADINGNLGNFVVKYKSIDATPVDMEEVLTIQGLTTNTARLNDLEFMSSLIEFSLILRNSDYKADASLNAIIERLRSLNLTDEYKREFLELVEIYSKN